MTHIELLIDSGILSKKEGKNKMNEFLEYLFFKIEEEKNTVEELIFIDNKIMLTNFKIQDIVEFIKNNLYQKQFFDFKMNIRTHILTEGNPLLIIKILNDYPNLIKKLYINREYVAINMWLLQKCFEFNNENLNIELDKSPNYFEYLKENDEITVFGTKEFVEEANHDFKRSLPSYII